MPLRSRLDQQIKLKRWRRFADCMLVSTPDLLEFVPQATLFPQVVDISTLSNYRTTSTKRSRSILRVGHAPTRRSTKGTDTIINAIENLRRESLPIELDLIEAETPEEVLRRFSLCDVGIDQLLSGWYGKVAVELMAIGKPVICYIDPRFDAVRKDLPIIRVTKSTLEATLRNLVKDPKLLGSLSNRSVQFVEKYHSVDAMVDELLLLYESI
jgi:hypothetical protein